MSAVAQPYSTETSQQQPQQATSQAVAPDKNEQPIYIDTQHDDMIHDAQLDYYGCKLATCSSDRSIKIFKVTNESTTHTATLQNQETGPIWSVAWSHPKFGSLLASASFDGSIIIHRERTSTPNDWSVILSQKNLHESSVNKVAFAPHEYGLIVAGASSDGTVSILTHDTDSNHWDVAKIRDNALGVNALSWGPYEEGCMRLVTGGCDNSVRFWKKMKEKEEWEIDLESVCGGDLTHSDWVRDVAWSCSSSNVVASCSEDGTVLVWTKKGDSSVWIPVLVNDFKCPVWSVSWNVTGNVLAISSGEGEVSMWKLEVEGVWSRLDTVEGADAQQ